jgi:serine phosphatase RsbU (regulator of sigma subunit)/anti-sigma regulatory factor (Ser/Thr protein kinase)
MKAPRETWSVAIGTDLEQVGAAVSRTLAWLQIAGCPAERIVDWKLPITEAVTNAVLHGCRDRADAEVAVTARVEDGRAEVRVRDPGRFVPGPDWDKLPEDLLSEHGRGGFLIATAVDDWRHENDDSGHTLILGWRVPPDAGYGLVDSARAAQAALKLTNELMNAYEITTSYAHFAGLLATSRDFPDLLHRVRERLRIVVPHAHFLLRFLEDGGLALAPGPAEGGFPTSVDVDDDFLECRTARSRRFATAVGGRELKAGDPLAAAHGPVAVLPVILGERLLGTLAIVGPAGTPLLSAGQIELLQSVADFLGVARATDMLWRQRSQQLQLEQELAVAADIQRSLLPQRMPDVAGWRIEGACRPAREVGGDYFDVVRQPDGSHLVLIADVMGKGVPAALVAAMLRSTLRALALDPASPAVLLARLNRQLWTDLDKLELFITAILLRIPAGPGPIELANAGHCPPLLLRSGAAPAEVPGGDVPLGVEARVEYAAISVPAQPGDWIFLYTDGCYEWRRSSGSLLGTVQLALTLAQAAATPGPVVDRVLDGITSDAGAGGLPDDCTLVALRRLS